MWWKLVVWFLLAIPEPTDLPGQADYPPEALEALQQTCYDLELADPRENWGQFPGELTACRVRYHEMADLPRLAEAYWLPPAELSHGNRVFAFELECGLRSRAGFSAWEDERLLEAAQEANRLGQIWLAAEAAVREDSLVWQRRCNLGNLKAALGPEDWWMRRMPSPVPLCLLER